MFARRNLRMRSQAILDNFAITLATLLAEIFGGIISGSLALLSDALHVGVDLGSGGNSPLRGLSGASKQTGRKKNTR